jgi:AcrR family transcriptional regulator
MRTVNQQRFEARRRQIREAALACFKRAGFHQTSMADICAEAGMSPGNLYRYFDSKEAIIETICEHDRLEVMSRIAAIGGRQDFFDAMLTVAAAAMTEGAEREKSRFACEVLAEAMRNERVAAIVRRHNAALLEMCTQAIAHAQAMGQVDPGLDARLAALLLMGTAEGLGIRLMLHPDVDGAGAIDAFRLHVARFLGLGR